MAKDKNKKANPIVELASDERFLDRIAKHYCNILSRDGPDAAQAYLQYQVHYTLWDHVVKPIQRELKRRGWVLDNDPDGAA